MVLRDEPASLTDAYALIKVLSREHGVKQFRVLANMARAGGQGETLFRRLQRVADRYLDVKLDYVGEVPDDACLGKAVRAQRSVVEAFPGCPSARAFKKLAVAADKWPMPPRADAVDLRILPGAAAASVGAATAGAAVRAAEAYAAAAPARDLDALVRRHADLVKRIAYHLAGRLPPQVEVDDLIQAGMIGLLEAAQHYTTGRGASFETYAGIRIRGAMLDALRKLDWAPRSVHRKARAAAAALRAVEAAARRRGHATPRWPRTWAFRSTTTTGSCRSRSAASCCGSMTARTARSRRSTDCADDGPDPLEETARRLRPARGHRRDRAAAGARAPGAVAVLRARS